MCNMNSQTKRPKLPALGKPSDVKKVYLLSGANKNLLPYLITIPNPDLYKLQKALN